MVLIDIAEVYGLSIVQDADEYRAMNLDSPFINAKVIDTIVRS